MISIIIMRMMLRTMMMIMIMKIMMIMFINDDSNVQKVADALPLLFECQSTRVAPAGISCVEGQHILISSFHIMWAKHNIILSYNIVIMVTF